MTKAKKNRKDKYDVIHASVDALPQIEARNKIIHKQFISAITGKPNYKYSDEGQLVTREGLMALLPDLGEEKITSALIDMDDVKMIVTVGTLHFPAHYFK